MEKNSHTTEELGKKYLSRQTIDEGIGGMKVVTAYIMLVLGWASVLVANLVESPLKDELLGFSFPWFLMALYAFWVQLSDPCVRIRRRTKEKVIGWTKYDAYHRDWRDITRTEEEWADAEQAIVDEIRRRKYKFGGNYHQYGKTGCPVMSDGSLFMVSMRGWGDIMSRVWGGDYCEYAWSDAMGRVPPQMRRPPPPLSEEERKERDEWRAKEALAIAKEIENMKNTPPRLDDLKKFLVDNEPEKE